MYLPSLKVSPLQSSPRSSAVSSVLASEPVRDVIRFGGVKISIGRGGYPTMLDSVPDPFRDLANGQIARRCACIAFILYYFGFFSLSRAFLACFWVYERGRAVLVRLFFCEPVGGLCGLCLIPSCR